MTLVNMLRHWCIDFLNPPLIRNIVPLTLVISLACLTLIHAWKIKWFRPALQPTAGELQKGKQY